MSFSIGDSVSAKVVFRDWDPSSNSFGDPIDPDTVDVTLYDSLGAVVFTEPAVREDVGVYSYEYVANTVGVFDLEFLGTFNDGSVSRVSSKVAVETQIDLVYLGSNFEFSFLTDIDPLLVDPEEFELIYPDATRIEVAELVHRFSKEVKNIYGSLEIPQIAYDYIRAAVECSLYRTYDLGFAGTGTAYALGDLSVSQTPYGNRNTVTRGNATTPCELAAALRADMMRTRTNMKAVTTGKNFRNPMPKRKLRHAERHF